MCQQLVRCVLAVLLPHADPRISVKLLMQPNGMCTMDGSWQIVGATRACMAGCI